MTGVGLVVVSHSARIADGVVALAGQMAPDVRVLAAGGGPGTDTAGEVELGTNYEQVVAALSETDRGSGVVLLYDIGSARMTAEVAVETHSAPDTVRLADAPLVEGAVAAAVAAQRGDALDAVVAAAVGAGTPRAAEQEETSGPQPVTTEETATESAELVLHNEVGLHARPAALVVRAVTGLRAQITVTSGDKRADATSVLALMGLGARRDDRIVVRADGPDAANAVRNITDLVERDFAE